MNRRGLCSLDSGRTVGVESWIAGESLLWKRRVWNGDWQLSPLKDDLNLSLKQETRSLVPNMILIRFRTYFSLDFSYYVKWFWLCQFGSYISKNRFCLGKILSSDPLRFFWAGIHIPLCFFFVVVFVLFWVTSILVFESFKGKQTHFWQHIFFNF